MPRLSVVVPLFMLILATANCGSSTEEDGAPNDEESTASEDQAMQRNSWGECIKVGITTHDVFQLPFGHSYFHGYVRDRKAGHYGGSELDIEIQEYSGRKIKVTQKRGHEIDDTTDNYVQAQFARAWGWDPCSNKWIVSPWVVGG
jgi:hypothetical protein